MRYLSNFLEVSRPLLILSHTLLAGKDMDWLDTFERVNFLSKIFTHSSRHNDHTFGRILDFFICSIYSFHTHKVSNFNAVLNPKVRIKLFFQMLLHFQVFISVVDIRVTPDHPNGGRIWDKLQIFVNFSLFFNLFFDWLVFLDFLNVLVFWNVLVWVINYFRILVFG